MSGPSGGQARGNEGSRMLAMAKKREEEIRQMEEAKAKIRQDNAVSVGSFGSKFGKSTAEVLTDELSKKTVGLVTLEDLKKTKEDLAKKERILGELQRQETLEAEAKVEGAKRKNRKVKVVKSALSFADDEGGEEGEEEESFVPKKKLKNPTVDTSFLPDRERELMEIEERKKLTEEWHDQQESIKKESIEITFSYWDGSGHRRSIKCTKGSSVGQFLELARRSLQEDFRELKGVASDNLLYIKEDLIIPQDMTFHYLIQTKARGKSGPLFHFDVHDDVRVVNDARVEKDESHAGKIVQRVWYERNKHIFPASRWETYDPQKKWEKYTIHGGEVQGNK
mmetsp:Transcript_39547/g.77447  ORF Transcript_39547/g.77447 Transcript_39547/m.77447 type:complete len:338 (-) Transcript_39547:129-1142(-)|eukprot:CAMPEP_0173385996 /NCGR_PEP_ID=MMETSP1356-20130122/8597_1 /TAXON_ID=77927 ORGANISM="Hemiselmis virescens, Strain PCC157" /NCGR_SAMPLE_ID=MMETSP1356 /ASSEMBLY_ACC=CAM_ASM_000847 /LENGTH=337 /DNA_ID=CAMNT_0014342041 /DNA_START=132 /DNA_END=1145 /DNA_ORIENTATION=+